MTTTITDMAGAGEMGPQREETLWEAVLRHQVGIDPDRVGPVLDLAAVGIVYSAWRRSPVEDWHASGGPLDDGDMLRSTHITWRVRQIIRRWRAEVGLTPDSHVTVLDTVEADAVDWPACVRAFLQVLDDPRHAHWGSDGSLRARLPPAPAQVADRAGLERILRRQPWSLESDAAQWVVNAGIRGVPTESVAHPS